MVVMVTAQCRGRRWLAGRLRERARRMLRVCRLRGAELSVLLVNDPQIRALNAAYRDTDRATDVLAFPMHGRRRPRRGPHLLGDIVISVDMAQRQAQADGDTLSAVAERLLIHGLLHLLGYDHEISEAEAQRMARRERYVARAIRREGRHRQ
jgi:rRNA maturation RNase YbeY